MRSLSEAIADAADQPRVVLVAIVLEYGRLATLVAEHFDHVFASH
jgi:hypothetical protein